MTPTPTPTPEQIEAQQEQAKTVFLNTSFVNAMTDAEDAVLVIATALATARLSALDESVNEMEIWFDNFMRHSHGEFQSPSEAIIALKKEPRR